MLAPCIIFFLLVMLAVPLQGATFRGVVLANELGGPPVSNVRLDVSAGASPTVSDDNGKFTLEFPAKQPGEMVQLTVSKPGHVVVNDVQLRLALPKDPDAETLVILLCKEENREEMARRFYRLKSFEAIDTTYQQRLNELSESQKSNAAEQARLREERDQARAAADKAAEELARLKPEETSEIYQQAMRLFLEGKVAEALQALDAEKLKRSVEAARKKKAEAEKALAGAIEGYLLKARLLIVQFRFGEAEKTYEEAMAADPASFNASFAYAVFSQELNRYQKAFAAYQRSIELARHGGNKAEVAATLNNLGILHRDQNRMDEARQAYEEALKIRRKLAETNPETYLPDVAGTLNNLGILHSDQNRMGEARQAYEEALKTYRELAKTNPETYLPYVAMTLNNLGVLYRDQNRMDEARQAYEEALKIRRELATTNPETYLPDVAETLNNLGTLHSDQTRTDEARQANEEALKTYRELAKTSPETYLPYVAGTLNNLGILHRDQNRMDEARQAFEEALKTYRELAKTNPETLFHVAGILNNLGVLHRDQNRMDEARQAYEEALKTYRELAETNPETYLPRVAGTLNNLGILHRNQNRMDEARQAYEEALKIFEKFAKKNPDRFSADVTRVQERLTELEK
ncbi:MAG: tetratricopeptide repeat protein [Gammaproteobacteria bacterium]